MNSCNPVFIEVGLKVGVKNFYSQMNKLGLLTKTGIDVPGEAGTIIHQIKNVGNVELATMSFGQSFQITPIQYLVAASAVVNGGTLITPHFGVKSVSPDGELVEKFQYGTQSNVVSEKTSTTMRYVLEKVISEGTGSKGMVEGYKVGGKTATSQKLPRGSGKYIASFMGFAPADNPQIIAMAIIDEPQGIYYGGQVAAPAISKLYKNILPYYLGEEK
jgi:stage V sporulation protein D (sporulation-specific penicillin-binding protein)